MENITPLLPLLTFAFVSSITPGPNNLMLTASGIRFGFIQSLPHMLGIAFGFAMLLTACALGVAALLSQVPSLQIILEVLASAYLLYLAWTMRGNLLKEGGQEAVIRTPMTFWTASQFQFINPKAWVMGITAAASFMPEYQPLWRSVAILVAIFTLVNLPCVSAWALMGALIKKYLTDPFLQKLFSIALIILTLYTAAAIWF